MCICVSECVCAHENEFEVGGGGGGSPGCQAHTIWAAGEGVAEVRSQN